VQGQVPNPKYPHHTRKGDQRPTGIRKPLFVHIVVSFPNCLQWNAQAGAGDEWKVYQQKLRVVYLPPEGQTVEEEDEGHGETPMPPRPLAEHTGGPSVSALTTCSI
jgi:hypothetical protein